MGLIRAKVRSYVCMGGNFMGSPPVDDLKPGNGTCAALISAMLCVRWVELRVSCAQADNFSA